MMPILMINIRRSNNENLCLIALNFKSLNRVYLTRNVDVPPEVMAQIIYFVQNAGTFFG